jgi:D-alanyl-D-alanine carboxypeptidase
MAIGKITYTYKGKEVGGSEIYYQKKTSGLSLSDSFDMSEWFDDAIEEANKEPFPWKTFLIVAGVSVVVIALSIYFVVWMRARREMRARRNRYKKSRQRMKDSGSGMFYRKR